MQGLVDVTQGRPDIDLSVHARKFLAQLLQIQLLLGFVVRPASVVVLHPAYSQGLLPQHLLHKSVSDNHVVEHNPQRWVAGQAPGPRGVEPLTAIVRQAQP